MKAIFAAKILLFGKKENRQESLRKAEAGIIEMGKEN